VTQSGASAELLERRWPQASPLLDALLDLPPESRADWLAAQPLDGELAALMQQLLASADAPGVLDADLLARVDTAEDCWQRRLGPWRVRRPIGSGGSASVYLGERADGAFEQRVAIKLLRSGVLDASERARFARERQLLARLTHPAIARLIDGGISPEGAPYLVLEYIDGLPIDRWCDARRLGVAARLRLFLDVCAAVQYAHRHLVIHRDLKPGNILVDHDGQVKLLDFGIARMLDDSAAPTETAARRMTPAYAAPEQLDGGVMSTAVDVYALGVLLHELLVGIRPQRAITLAGAARNVSAALLHSRDARASALASAVRGDLQAIVDTALQPEPGRRYPSVAALALDIERHLEGLPVGVRAAARGYRAQRWLRRHALSSAALLLLIATLSLAAWYATRQAHEAQTQALRAQAVQDFLVELLQAAGSDGGRTTPTSVDELMRLAAGRALDAFPQAPQTRATLLRTLGRLLHEQGRLDEAERTLQAAQAVEHGELGLPAQGSLATRQALALLASVRQPEAAAATLRDVLVEQRRSHAPPGEQALTLETLGFIDSRAGRHPVALAQLREAVSLSAGSARHATTLMLLGDALQRAGNASAARAHWQQALAAAPPQSIVESRVLCGIGYAQLRSGELAAARAAFERALGLQQRLLPAEHPYTAVTLVALGSLEFDSGEMAAAQRYFERALPMREHLYGRDSVEAVEPMVGLSDALAGQNDDAQAIAVLRDAWARLHQLAPEQQPTRAWVLLHLSAALRRNGAAGEALDLAEQALAIYQQAHGASDSKTIAAHVHAEHARHALGDSQGALTRIDALLAQLDATATAPLRELRARIVAEQAPPRAG